MDGPICPDCGDEMASDGGESYWRCARCGLRLVAPAPCAGCAALRARLELVQEALRNAIDEIGFREVPDEWIVLATGLQQVPLTVGAVAWAKKVLAERGLIMED